MMGVEQRGQPDRRVVGLDLSRNPADRYRHRFARHTRINGQTERHVEVLTRVRLMANGLWLTASACKSALAISHQPLALTGLAIPYKRR
jgi:hypothetical protein